MLYVSGGGTKVPLFHDLYIETSGRAGGNFFEIVQWHATGGVIWNTTFANETYSLACDNGSDIDALLVKFDNVDWDSPSSMGNKDVQSITGRPDGTTNLYVEDSIFLRVGGFDVDDGARVVVRHTTMHNAGGASHGPTSATGGRFIEFYDNTFLFDAADNLTTNLNRWYWTRGGGFLATGNSIPLISSQCHGVRSTFQFIVENATRSTSHKCCTASQCWHQPGSGSDGIAGQNELSAGQTGNVTYGNCNTGGGYDSCQKLDPVYIWNNTGTGQTSGNLVSTNDNTNDCATGHTTANFFRSGIEYFADTSSNPNNGEKPGWARYTYPHPLRQGTAPTSPPAPSGLAAITH
jgi:hypothetical protein